VLKYNSTDCEEEFFFTGIVIYFKYFKGIETLIMKKIIKIEKNMYKMYKKIKLIPL